MTKATVSCRTEFESAYIRDGELNAHRYRIEVTVDGDGPYNQSGQVIDYRSLLKYVKTVVPDKCYLVSTTSTQFEQEAASAIRNCGVIVHTVPYYLSIERICQGIADELQDILNRHEYGVRVVEVKLRETADCFATWSIQ